MRLLSIAAFALLGLFLSTHTALSTRAQDVSHAEGPQAAPTRAPSSQVARSHGTIAYTNGREIRLIEWDGSDDRVVWMVPDTAYAISRLAWSPDGEEIAFASDHEMATSFYERDIFGIRPDGTGLRKLTNPPVYQELASYEKGTVTVAVSNFSGDGGPFFVYVSGAAAPQQVSIGPGATRNLEFTDVADLGEDAFQHVVVISGIFRWWDAAVAADVEAGTTVDAGTINMTSAFEHYGADGPFWRADGSRIAFFQTAGESGTSTCILEQIPVPPPFGFYSDPIFDPELFETPCAVDWAPLPALADQMLVTDYTDYVENGEVHVYRVSEGSQNKGEPIVTFDGYVQIYDIRWLPDGSGFLLARHDGLLERGLNLYEYEFESGSLSRITDFQGEEEGVRTFSISPDGQYVVFEYVANADDQIGDLWIMRRDGSERTPLVSGGSSPHWNVQESQVGLEHPVDVPSMPSSLQVYPHPVVSRATLSYHLRQPQDVMLTVHDVLGREIIEHNLGVKTPGEHTATFDAGSYSPGIYLISVVGSVGERITGQVVILE